MALNDTSEAIQHGCSLNNEFGLGVQGVLAFSAFCILILKRLREPVKERRPVRIWFCDTSKQAIGAMIIHFANVFLAELAHEKDPCTLYFINFLLDTTVGLLVIWLALRLLECVATQRGWYRLKMGEYGSPPEFQRWAYQCIAYVCVMFFEKSVIVALFQLHFWSTVKKFILKPVSGYPKVELVLVMLVVPFIMNAFMFWVVDNFLMRKHARLFSSVSSSSKKYKIKRSLNPVHYAGRRYLSHSDDEVNLLMADDDSDGSDELLTTSESEFLHKR